MLIVFLCNSVRSLAPHCTNVFITDEGFSREVLQRGRGFDVYLCNFLSLAFVKYSSVLRVFFRSQETSVHCILLRNSLYVAPA
jgi:hypothetical protein